MNYISPRPPTQAKSVLALTAVLLAACASVATSNPAMCDKPITLSQPHVARFNAVNIVDDHTLAVSGWVYDSVYRSAYRWQRWTVDLTRDTFTEVPTSTVVPLGDPCSGGCDIAVIDQSPNLQWQLLNVNSQMSAGKVGDWGIWLVGRGQQLKLSKPAFANKWQWADDSSVLWFSTAASYGFGMDGTVVFLQNPAITRTLSTPLIGEDDGKVVLNPLTKEIASISFTLGVSLLLTTPHTLNIYAVAANTVVLRKTEQVNGLVRVSWDEDRQTMLHTIVRDDGLHVTTQAGAPLAYVPQATFEHNHFLMKKLSSFSGVEGIRFSSDGKILTWVSGRGISVYRCATR